MARCPNFYSRREHEKPVDKRVYHNNDKCAPGIDVKANHENEPGQNGYRPCEDCKKHPY